MNYIVVKCGGSVLENLPKSFYHNVVALQQSGEWMPIIVHGGGPLITSLLKKLNVESGFVNGLRVTDQQVLDVVEMVLSGFVNKKVVRNLTEAGGQALGVSGVDGTLLEAVPSKTAEGLGYVGDVEKVNQSLLTGIIDQGYVPVISPVGIDRNGQRYNINGDIAASAVAQAMGASLCFISDIPGILVGEHNEKKRLPTITKSKLEEMIQDKPFGAE